MTTSDSRPIDDSQWSSQPLPVVEVVVVDANSGEDARATVERLTAAGVDVVFAAADEAELDVDVAVDAGAPGMVVVRPGEVEAAVAWARRWLVGPGGPDSVLVVGEGLPAEADRVVAAATAFPTPGEDPSWRLDKDGYDPSRERDIESWFTVANGRTGTRGSIEERSHEAGAAVFVAGVYGRPEGQDAVPELVRGPDWTTLCPAAGNGDVELHRGQTVEHRRVLDLRQGLLLRYWRQGLPTGEHWRFRSARFASQADRAVMALEAEAACNGHEVHLANDIPLPHGETAISSAEVKTDGDRTLVSLQAREGRRAFFAASTRDRDGRVERLVAVDRGHHDGEDERAVAALELAEAEGLLGLRTAHRRAWRLRWCDADVVLRGDPDLQRALRFSLYHLISSGDPESDIASIGARGLSGHGYGGRVFWDTEVFVLPFFIWTHPATARALLSYRYRTLPGARRKAEQLGYRGALYAWESAETGDECTPPYAWLPDGTRLKIRTGLEEHHISADVAWAVWQYWQVTGDDDFLAEMGAEILVETARFWASRPEPGPDDRLHIRGVIGPDEYHEGVDDNAFTNVMARWNLLAAVEVCERLGDELPDRLGVEAVDLDRWREVAAGLYDGFDPGTKLYEQFAGFSALNEIIAADLRPRPFTGELALGVEGLRHSQVIKQADVVMLTHLLRDELPADVVMANYRHYEPRTSHGSSLSPAIYSAVAARLGLVEEGEQYFRMAAAIDLDDRMGNAEHGVHIATMGGLWQAAVFGFGGVRPEREALGLNPHLPAGWQGLTFPVQWRGTRVQVEVGRDELQLHLDGPASVALGELGADPTLLRAGSYVSRRGPDGWMELTELAEAVEAGSRR